MPTTLPDAPAGYHGAASSAPDYRYLVPEDAYFNSTAAATMSARKRKGTTRSASRRRKVAYKKLLWFRQPFPDNYTDEETFLDHLQRNPRLQPYEFWALMSSLTVIVQQVASVAIFCCAFVVIFQERVSPESIVGWASFCSFLAWVLWDYWMGQEESAAAQHARDKAVGKEEGPVNTTTASTQSPRLDIQEAEDSSRGTSAAPSIAISSDAPKDGPPYNEGANSTSPPPYVEPVSSLSPRNQQRLSTVKSAILIYAALLGLSPILKSLTKSTTSDSIWAFTTWLLFMNVACFDYSSGTGTHLPASISTNSALMASTVLASRLPSTTHVFSLSLFSIEVFGLFPIFRRQLRAKSPNGHLALTMALVATAGGSLFVVLTGGGRVAFTVGVILGSFVTFLAMGMCSWYLISLQKYKNEIYGPWDPARPVIRRRLD